MKINWKESSSIRKQNELVNIIKDGKPVMIVLNNTAKELTSFMKFMNRLKKSNIEMNIGLILNRDKDTDNRSEIPNK
jgi:uncharacterized protein YvpB